MSNAKKVVLAYSGGLDTSFCIKYLSAERGMEVHAVTVDTGGFDAAQRRQLEERAHALGAASWTLIDAVEDYYAQCIRYLVFGNVLRNHTYPLSVSAERLFQAMETARFAQKIGAQAVAHGSTGAGNDQVRFDLAFQVLAPELEIITPIRDLRLSREEEVAFLRKHGVELEWEKAQYSINQGLWGTSVGGAETLTSHRPLPEAAWPTQPEAGLAPRRIALQFAQGELVGVDGAALAPVDAIRRVEALARPYAVGRGMHVGDTIIGIKGRVGFEAAAPLIIIGAHQLLEKHVLTKWQQYWKDQLATWYGMMLHEGQFFDPLMRNIEAFLADTQQPVTGTVWVRLEPLRFELEGIESPFDLMQSDFGQYGEMNNAWTGEDVKGFTRILANQSKLVQQVSAAAKNETP